MPTLPVRIWPALLLLGFASGLPEPLVNATLATWLKQSGWTAAELVDFGWVALPYTIKVLWAPLVDRLVPPLLGRRRGWLLIMQMVIIVGLVVMSGIDVNGNRAILVAAALLVAFASATQDLVVNGYTCDALPPDRLAAGAGLWVWGYRVANQVVSAGVALLIAAAWGWSAAYLVMAACLLPGVIGTLLAPPPIRDDPPLTWTATLVEPMADFHRRLGLGGVALLLGVVMCYRLPDGMAGLLTAPFQAELYKLVDLGTSRIVVGLLGGAVGVAAAAWALPRLGMMRSLVLFGILQAVSNLGYVGLDQRWWTGIDGLIGVLFIDYACGAAGAVIFVGYLMSFCTASTSATQYALLFAAYSITPHLLRPVVSALLPSLGYSGFFLATVVAVVPGLVLLAFAGRLSPPPLPPQQPPPPPSPPSQRAP